MPPRLSSDQMLNMDLASMLKGLADGHFTSQELVQYYLDRIETYNPHFNPVACTNPDALAIAKERDEQRSSGSALGPLHGIPIMVKDTLVTADRMDTTAGSWALVGARWPHESTVIQRLRAAGAVLLGKNTMGEWGGMWSSSTPPGWSARWGQVTGAFYPGMHGGGSSTGCGVGASLGVAAGFIGGETDISITSPARRAGVVGLKPTPGLTSRSAVVPLSSVQDTLGPMTRWVKDSALILQSIAGKDDNDPLTHTIPFDTLPNYVAACDASRLKGMRIAVLDSVWESIRRDNDPATENAFKAAITLMESLGATVVQGVDMDTFIPWESFQGDDFVLDVEVRKTLEKFLATISHNPNDIHTLADVVSFARAHPDLEHTEKYPPTEFERASTMRADTPAYAAQESAQATWAREPVAMLDRHNCDVIMTVRAGNPYSLARMPVIAVPMGRWGPDEPVEEAVGMPERAPNIPFGLMFVARPFEEEKLLTCAYAYEQATKQILSNSEALMMKF